MTTASAPLLLTPGDPAGIGGEIALRAWAALAAEGGPAFTLMDEPGRLSDLADRIGLDVPLREIADARAASDVFREALPVLRHDWPTPVRPGEPDPANARGVIAAIDRAVSLVRFGEASGVVTNPIAKSVLQTAGFAHPGHTEYLASLSADGGRAPMPVMMLACPELRVVPVTVHIPLKDVPGALSRDGLMTTARIAAEGLRRDFGIAEPRLAVAGLNPHAGEQGRMGREEIDLIGPAIDSLRAEGLDITGPLSADTMFHPAARARYDAALCMYHDQALIPIKTVDFARGVNVTLGLSFVRTSPDHGTAFSLAATGGADPTSLIEALRTARRMAANRAAAGCATTATHDAA